MGKAVRRQGKGAIGAALGTGNNNNNKAQCNVSITTTPPPISRQARGSQQQVNNNTTNGTALQARGQARWAGNIRVPTTKSTK